MKFQPGQRCIYINSVKHERYCIILEQMPLKDVYRIKDIKTGDKFFSGVSSLHEWNIDSNNLLKDVL